MGALDRIRARLADALLAEERLAPAVELVRTGQGQELRATSLAAPPQYLRDAWVDVDTSTGQAVGPESAARHIDVYACVRVLGDAVGSLPLHVYQRQPDGGRERADSTGVARLLAAPHPALTPSAFKATVMAHLTLWGNAYVAKLRPRARAGVGALWPIDPARVGVGLDGSQPVYIINKGTTDDYEGVFTPRDIIHIKALSTDGLVGLSPIQQARNALGLGIAMEEYAARFFANSAHPSGVLQVPGLLSDDARERLKGDWNAMHQGMRLSHRVAVLEAGMVWQAIGMPNTDMQFLEQRKLSATQIARLFRVPPWMIAADDGGSLTYSNTEQQQLAFMTHSVRPWLVSIEEALRLDEDLFDREGPLYPEFDMDAAMRSDTLSRAQAYEKALGGTGRPAWMTVNEVRQRENLPSIEGGDELNEPEAPTGAGEGEAAPAEEPGAATATEPQEAAS